MPGPYLRRTMLKILARKSLDLVLPEAFKKMVSEITFGESKLSPAISPDQEKMLAMSRQRDAEAIWILGNGFTVTSMIIIVRMIMIVIVIVARIVGCCCQW
ncbi:uncharacterized protein EURHEDRAFT_98253 [Aspergillus ruber CBS 135680]|uniref:Uncharacterized protein n=1 Tax=Aspergillus ruber (strain CBS 135680) TaxID=1388766 RepID=A0A017SC46_ASPRC|nr:uncharacterized protein EURHEDRAFT_98253 [Aspergillus ruber CBS 135680]EYE94209.1 hypothetical protein EURHEDRAFT_98253 [Aspergillus ruber CBS 135680]